MKHLQLPFFLLLLFLSAATTLAQTTHHVNVSGTSFNPDDLVIQVGDQVTWTNTSGSHNVNGTTATYPSNPESFGNSVGSGWTYSYTFNTVGTYDYRCNPHFNMGMTGTVTVNAAPVAPSNDDCANATLLTVEGSCVMSTYDSENATTQGVEPAPNPGCGFYQGGDVWFKAVVPASGALRVEKANGTLNAQFAIYSGTCGNMQVVSCAQLDPARTIHEPSLAGQEVYIRVWGYNTSNGGTFDLCVWEPEIPVNNYCNDAITLTVGQSCSFETYTSIYSTAEEVSVAPNPNCGFYNGGDVWFNFVLPAPGELRIDVENIVGNTQYAVYSGTCGNFEQVDCAQLDGGTTLVLPEFIGQTLYLRTWGYNSEEGSEFDICLWDPPVPTNDLCANALPLSVTDTCDLSAFSGLYATTDTVGTAPNPSCGFYAGGDVWFTLEVPYTGVLHYNWENTFGNAQFALYEGTCGNFTNEVACAQLTDHIDIQDPSLANETLYLRMFGYNSEEGTEIEYCAFDTICSSFEVEIVLQGNTLVSTGVHFSYTWMGCPGTPDPGTVEATYTPTESGDYRLIADNPSTGCIDTSECVNVLVTGLDEPARPQIQVHPNPSNDVFQIDLGNATNARVQLLDMQGRTVMAERNMTGRTELNLSELSEGIYQLVVRTDSGTISEKIVLQRP